LLRASLSAIWQEEAMAFTTNGLVEALDRPAIDAAAEPLRNAVRSTFAAGGAAGEAVKNTLHGVWLGHPLHPVFTDIPVGAWTTALAIDAAAGNDPGMRRAATFAMGVGLVGAAGAAVTGLTDWSEVDGRARRLGLIHGLLNVAATTLMATAFMLRRNDSDSAGRACAWTGFGIALASAYLGGDLVYGERVGVTHAAIDEPELFTRIGGSANVPEGTMRRMRNGDTDTLVARQHGRVCALAHPCAHLGGPLSEGTLKDGSVVCPWHGSEFSLDDGRVLNGPATQNQPCLEVREVDGAIEVKAPNH